jgi:hypothetical protein
MLPPYLLAGLVASQREQQIRQDQQQRLLSSAISPSLAFLASDQMSSLKGEAPAPSSHILPSNIPLASTQGFGHPALRNLLELEKRKSLAAQLHLVQETILRRQQHGEQQRALEQKISCYMAQRNQKAPGFASGLARDYAHFTPSSEIKAGQQQANKKRSLVDEADVKPSNKKATMDDVQVPPPLSVPCRCRGMPDDHNPKVSYKNMNQSAISRLCRSTLSHHFLIYYFSAIYYRRPLSLFPKMSNKVKPWDVHTPFAATGEFDFVIVPPANGPWPNAIFLLGTIMRHKTRTSVKLWWARMRKHPHDGHKRTNERTNERGKFHLMDMLGLSEDDLLDMLGPSEDGQTDEQREWKEKNAC